MESLKLDRNGDIQFELVSGADELAQSCRISIGTNKGEWFLNPELGIPFSKFLGKQVSEEEMRSELTAGLLQDSRIQSIERIEFTIDYKTRKLVVNFSATSLNGEEIIAKGVEIGA